MRAASQKLRIIAAALRMQAFTTRDLAEASRTSLHTVRTVLRRHTDWFETLPSPRSRSRGASFRLYRVRPLEAAALWREVDALVGAQRPYSDQGNPANNRAHVERSAERTVTALEIVDLLGRQFRAAKDQNHVVEMAELALFDLSGDDRFEVTVMARLLGAVLALRQWQLRSGKKTNLPDRFIELVQPAAAEILGLPTPKEAHLPTQAGAPLAGDADDPLRRVANEFAALSLRMQAMLPDRSPVAAAPTNWGGTSRATRDIAHREREMLDSLAGPVAAAPALGEAVI